MKTKINKIAIYLGNDLIAHLIFSKFVQTLKKHNVPFIVYKPVDTTNSTFKSQEIQKLSIVERGLFNKVFTPLVERVNYAGFKLKTLTQLQEKYQFEVKSVRNVNAPDFISELEEQNIDLGISIRCYQKFKESSLTYFAQNNRLLVNLHPGVLPDYRGLLSTFRAMTNKESDSGFTLHKVDANWDTGAIIKIAKFKIDYTRSAFANLFANFLVGADLLSNFLSQIVENGQPECDVREDSEGAHFSFPNEFEIASAKENSIYISDFREALDIYRGCLGNSDFYSMWAHKELNRLVAESGIEPDPTKLHRFT